MRSLLRIKRYQDEIKELNRTLEQRVQSQVDALEHQADELRASRARIVAAADAERRRIERDLHDGAQQYLVGLAANLRAAEGLIESDPAKAKAILDELSGTIGQAMQEFRDLSHGIYPPLLQDRGLGEALANAARGLPIPARGRPGRDRPLRARRRGDGLLLLRRGASERGQARRRERGRSPVGAERDRVLRGRRRRPRASIRHGKPGAGLTNMRDRVGAIGGSVEIGAANGSGTAVRGSIPAQPSAR